MVTTAWPQPATSHQQGQQQQSQELEEDRKTRLGCQTSQRSESRDSVPVSLTMLLTLPMCAQMASWRLAKR